jgi:hypothetical protein
MKSIVTTLLITAVLALLMSSCSLEKRCAARFPPSSTTKDSTVIKEEVRFRDVEVYLPKDSVVIRDSVRPNYHAHAKGNHVSAEVKFDNGIFEVKCKTDSLLKVVAQLTDTLREVRQSSSKQVTAVIKEQVEVPKPYIPAIFWYSLAANVVLLLWVFRTPVTRLFKSLLPKVLTLFR